MVKIILEDFLYFSNALRNPIDRLKEKDSLDRIQTACQSSVITSPVNPLSLPWNIGLLTILLTIGNRPKKLFINPWNFPSLGLFMRLIFGNKLKEISYGLIVRTISQKAFSLSASAIKGGSDIGNLFILIDVVCPAWSRKLFLQDRMMDSKVIPDGCYSIGS